MGASNCNRQPYVDYSRPLRELLHPLLHPRQSVAKWPGRRNRPGREHSDAVLRNRRRVRNMILPRPPRATSPLGRASPPPSSACSRTPRATGPGRSAARCTPGGAAGLRFDVLFDEAQPFLGAPEAGPPRRQREDAERARSAYLAAPVGVPQPPRGRRLPPLPRLDPPRRPPSRSYPIPAGGFSLTGPRRLRWSA
jgi:hypothetical protein